MLAPLDDRALVAAAQDGDRGALDRLLRHHYDRIHAVCRRITGNEADAADAAQEALMAIVRGLARFDGRASFATWVYRVATNASLDELRRRRRRPLLAIGDHGDDDHEHGHAEPADPHGHGATESAAERLSDRQAIEAALLTLPDEFRLPVVLRDIADLDYAEIAEVLDVPIGTVKSRIARGRGQLATALRRHDPALSGNSDGLSERPTHDRTDTPMNDDLHPDPTDTELLASALIDGALPADEAGSAQASPEVAALAEQFTAVRTVLADVPPAPIEARERALAAALAVFEELHSATPAAAAAAPAGLAPVVRLADRRRWPSRVLAAAAAVMVLGIVGVSVFRSPGGNDSASQGTELARGEMAADQVATATIGAINAPASPAIAVHSPEELAALAEAKLAPTPLASSPDTTTAADGEVAGASVGGGSLALGCLDDTQVFVADILYNGRTAIAARDTVTGVTQAIDEQCNVLAEAAP